jgi:hypothetical protein
LLQDEKSLKHILSLGVEKQKIDTNTSDEVIVTLDLNMTTIKQIKDVYYTLPIPYVKSGLDKFKTSFNTSERKTLLHFPSLIVESYTYDIKLDKDWTLVNKDVNIVEKNELAEMQIKISQENKGEVIQVNKTFKLLKQDITTEEYPQLEKMLSIWYDNKYQDLKLR